MKAYVMNLTRKGEKESVMADYDVEQDMTEENAPPEGNVEEIFRNSYKEMEESKLTNGEAALKVIEGLFRDYFVREKGFTFSIRPGAAENLLREYYETFKRRADELTFEKFCFDSRSIYFLHESLDEKYENYFYIDEMIDSFLGTLRTLYLLQKKEPGKTYHFTLTQVWVYYY